MRICLINPIFIYTLKLNKLFLHLILPENVLQPVIFSRAASVTNLWFSKSRLSCSAELLERKKFINDALLSCEIILLNSENYNYPYKGLKFILGGSTATFYITQNHSHSDLLITFFFERGDQWVHVVKSQSDFFIFCWRFP